MLEQRDGFTLTDEMARLDPAAIAALVQTAPWARERSAAAIVESLAHSICFGLLEGTRLVGFVRAISDRAVNAYVCDFILSPEVRGRGLGAWMLAALLAHPDVARANKLLLTEDAQEFYRRHGFETHPFECMRRRA